MTVLGSATQDTSNCTSLSTPSLFLFTFPSSYLGQGKVLVEAYLQVEDRSQGEGGGEPKQQQDEGTDHGIQDHVGKPCHRRVHHI